MEVESSVVNGHHGNGLNHEDKPVVMNGDVDFGSTNGAASMIIMNSSNPIDQRIKKRARRLMRQNSKEATSPNGASAVVQATRSFKNSRRPRNGYGRGLPKKGGAGGKGVWGKPGSELLETDLDMHDPNYDSDTIDNGDVELKTIFPLLSDEELQKSVEPIVLEYFEHGDTNEACLAFEELHAGKKRFKLPVLAIEIAMDHKPSHREMTSVLISDMYGRVVSERDIARAFDQLLTQLPDLVLDTPDADTVLANFLARAVADDCLPPRYVLDLEALTKLEPPQHNGDLNGMVTHNGDGDGVVAEPPAPLINELSKVTVTRAATLLTLKHGLVRLDNVWGIGGGTRPVKSLIRQMVLLLKEYLSSGDIQEASRCLLELEVPHFHHELVYEAVVMTLEAISGPTEEKMSRLLKSLSDAVIITPDQMERGFLRVFEDMPDICLDVPLAYSVLDRFMERCQKAAFITHELIKKLPSRGRKRFVSEGDGGRIKDHY